MPLTIRHNTPTLKSTQSCPSCGAPIEPEARLCTQCGTNLETGEPMAERSWFAKNKFIAISTLGGVIFSVIILTLVFWPAMKSRQRPVPAAEPIAPAVTEEPAVADPLQTDNPRAAFEAKKQKATEKARAQLNEIQPLYQIGEAVELRRKNGLVDRGTLQGYAGSGTGRVALVATPTSEVGVPLIALDKPSRRRADPEYRKQFLQHLMSTAPAEDARD